MMGSLAPDNFQSALLADALDRAARSEIAAYALMVDAPSSGVTHFSTTFRPFLFSLCAIVDREASQADTPHSDDRKRHNQSSC